MVSKSFKIILLFALFTLTACAGQTIQTVADGSPPVLLSAAPLVASRGSSVTLTGSGFSIVPPENVVIIAGTSTTASTYVASGAGETITFRVPDAAPLGEQNILVIIDAFADALSNQVTLTITP